MGSILNNDELYLRVKEDIGKIEKDLKLNPNPNTTIEICDYTIKFLYKIITLCEQNDSASLAIKLYSKIKDIKKQLIMKELNLTDEEYNIACSFYYSIKDSEFIAVNDTFYNKPMFFINQRKVSEKEYLAASKDSQD